MNNLEGAENYVRDKIFSVDKEWIEGFNEQIKSFQSGINNVIRLLKRDSYFCFGYPDYYLIGYITNHPTLEGYVMEIDYNEPNHNAIVLAFGRDIAMIYPQNSLDMIDVANSIQSLKYEIFSSSDENIVFSAKDVINKFGQNVTMAFLHKPINIEIFDKVEFYTDIFFESNSVIAIEEKTDRSKIYIQYNKRNNFHKIGRSKNARFRDKKLQSEEPEIHMLDCWIAPKEAEKDLYNKYKSKRKRGEWFNLTGKDLLILMTT